MTTDREGFEIVSKAKFAELLEGEVRPQDALLWPLQTRITQQALAMDRSHAPRCRVGQIYAVGGALLGWLYCRKPHQRLDVGA